LAAAAERSMVIDGGIGRTRVRGQSFKLTGFE
jgi:hypothetical protein